MLCSYCRSEVDAEALICPHCRKRTELGRKDASKRRTGTVLLLLAIPGGILMLVLVIGSLVRDRSPVEPIGQACKQQFPYDASAKARCEIALSVKTLSDDDSNRLRAAARSAGVKPD